MTPNPEIWGAPNTWIPSQEISFQGNGDTSKKTIKPKKANFGDNNGTLSKGNTAGKTVLNYPIDATICPCGQDKNASCFGKIAIFKNFQNADSNKIPVKVIKQMLPINWFLYTGRGIGYSDPKGHLRDRSNTAQRWAPNANLTDNWNGYISPFTYWQIKSICVLVKVACITGYDSYGRPNFTWRYLNDWKTTYNTQKILDIQISFRGYSSDDSTTIAYTSSSEMTRGYFGGVGLLKDFDGITDYAAFGMGPDCSFSLIGYVLSGNYYNTTGGFYLTGYQMFDNSEVKAAVVQYNTDGGWTVWQEIPYSEANYNKIMSMIACFGIPFTDKNQTRFPIDFIDDDLYIPVIDQEGIAHGEYTHGSDSSNNPYLLKSSLFDYDYNPVGFDIIVGDKIVRKIYYAGQQVKRAYFANKKL